MRRRWVALRHRVLVRLLELTSELRVTDWDVLRCPIRLLWSAVISGVLRTGVETLRIIPALLAGLAPFTKVGLIPCRYRAGPRDTV